MCKILGFVNVGKVKNLANLIKRGHAALNTQKDGFGFALHHDGKVYAEKWDEPADFPGAFRYAALKPFFDGAGIPLGADATIIGTPPDAAAIQRSTTPTGLIMHGRISTCQRGSINAHPHVSDDRKWALVHNGIVTSKKGITRSCDSMLILDSIVANSGPQKIHEDVKGYMALLGFTPEGRFFAIHDDSAPLYVTFIPTWQTWAFGTSLDLIQEAVGTKTKCVEGFALATYEWCESTAEGKFRHEKVTQWSSGWVSHDDEDRIGFGGKYRSTFGAASKGSTHGGYYGSAVSDEDDYEKQIADWERRHKSRDLAGEALEAAADEAAFDKAAVDALDAERRKTTLADLERRKATALAELDRKLAAGKSETAPGGISKVVNIDALGNRTEIPVIAGTGGQLSNTKGLFS